MHLNKLTVLNFKNIGEATLHFSPGVNCLVGSNGMGKSNLLEAIHYLAMTRSFLNLPDQALLRHGMDTMMLQATFTHDSGTSDTVSMGYHDKKRKVFKCNGKECKPLSMHIGMIPLVVVSPHDSRIVSDSAEERRRLMDMVISQADKTYLAALIRYNRAMTQRNSMLRQGMYDRYLTESVEIQMSESARYIHQARAQWVSDTAPAFEHYYTHISGNSESASMAYKSILSEMDMEEVFHRNRAKDAALGHTSAGVHRDDINMLLDSYSVRRLASQGQIKSYTLALRLAIFEYLKLTRRETPILLLDDIFDKLDSSRVENILHTVSEGNPFGQIFITDTNRKHIDTILSRLGNDHLLLTVDNGRFTKS